MHLSASQWSAHISGAATQAAAGCAFNWRLTEVPGVGHDGGRMGGAAIVKLLQTGSSSEEPNLTQASSATR